MLAALLARLLTHSIVKEVIIRLMFKRLALRILESRIGKGKLTFAGLAVLLLPVFDNLTGADISSADLQAAIAGIGSVMVVVGKLRAVYQAHKAGLAIGAGIAEVAVGKP